MAETDVVLEEEPKRAPDVAKLTPEAARDTITGTPNVKEEKPPDEKPKYEPRGEAEKLPWDKERQKRDTLLANLGKSVEALAHKVDELAKAKAPGRPKKTAQDVLAEIAELESPDDISSDEEIAAYRKKVQKLHKEAVRLTEDSKEPEPKKEPVKEPKKEPEEEKPSGITQDEFYKVLDTADKQYGAEYRREAAKRILAEFKKRGFTDGNIPVKQTVEDIVMRVYAELASKATKKDSEPKEEPKPEAKAEQRLKPEAVQRMGLKERVRQERIKRGER